MAEINPKQVIATLGLANPLVVDADSGWELWKYRIRDPASQSLASPTFYLLYLKSSGVGWEKLPAVVSRVKNQTNNHSLSVIIPLSNRMSKNMDRLKREIGTPSVFLPRELLSKECQNLFGVPHQEMEPVQFFVEPFIDSVPALERLISWLSGKEDVSESARDSDSSPNIAVLLAPAGVGKTSVSHEITRILPRRHSTILPLLISSRQWRKIAQSSEFSLWGIVRSCLQRRILLRGGISYGECIMDLHNHIFLGQPIIDAYLTEENQSWSGAAFHKSVRNHPLGNILMKFADTIEYHAPLKSEGFRHQLSGHVLNWINYAYVNLGEILPSLLHEAATPRAKEIITNTQSFYNSIS